MFLLLFAWPTWMLLRTALPIMGTYAITIAPAVDLQLIESYFLIFPICVILRLRGWQALVTLLIRVALIACVIAFVSWVLFKAGVIPAGEWSVVQNSSSTAGDVRPGGELVVCIAAVLVLLLPRRYLGSGRALMITAILIELALSKTLSLLLAVGIGFTATLFAGWHGLRARARFGAAALAVVFLALALGVVDTGGRYDLQERVDDSSGQYRAEEVNTMKRILTESPTTFVLGVGVGTEFAFNDEYIHEIKRDTHSVLLSVAAKTGTLGVVLFIAPFFWAAARAFRRGGQSGRALAGALVGVFVVSLTVPWWWTIGGMTAVLVLYVATSTSHLEPESARPQRLT